MSQIRLNLGSGYLPLPNYVNVDIMDKEPNYKVDIVHDITKIREIYQDNTVDEIFAKDCLEHISYLKTKETLEGWIGILKPGGVLKIRVPDLDRCMDEYFTHRNDVDAKKRFKRMEQLVYGMQDFPENTHVAAFRRDYLIEDLEKIGMRIVNDWYDGGRDLRITAIKGNSEPLVDLAHPDYQYIELNPIQHRALFK